MEVWNATMEVKIKQAETLVKELTAQIASKKVSKFKSNDVYDRYARDLKAELIAVPFCANCLEFGHLTNPRIMPDPKFNIFNREIYDDNGVKESVRFDAKTFGNVVVSALRTVEQSPRHEPRPAHEEPGPIGLLARYSLGPVTGEVLLRPITTSHLRRKRRISTNETLP